MEHGYIKGLHRSGVASSKSMSAKQFTHGFTLIELIMALTVLAVAIAGLVAMYGVSLEVANESRQKALAAEVASSQLAAILAAPDTFIWNYDASSAMSLFPIVLGKEDPKAGNVAAPPDVKLINRTIHARNELLYRKFRWKAWGRLPSPDAQSYEVTVNVQWETRGKARSLALTSSVPCHRAPASVQVPEKEML
jgi:prepilin-type N-terminal cleavage/methylation domain-containing protein